MIHAFEIQHNECKLFEKFMREHCAGTDYKFCDSGSVYRMIMKVDQETKVKYMVKTMNALVLFRTRLEGEYVEMAWHMLKYEIKQNQVAMAA
jgi:hypothetical protein